MENSPVSWHKTRVSIIAHTEQSVQEDKGVKEKSGKKKSSLRLACVVLLKTDRKQLREKRIYLA